MGPKDRRAARASRPYVLPLVALGGFLFLRAVTQEPPHPAAAPVPDADRPAAAREAVPAAPVAARLAPAPAAPAAPAAPVAPVAAPAAPPAADPAAAARPERAQTDRDAGTLPEGKFWLNAKHRIAVKAGEGSALSADAAAARRAAGPPLVPDARIDALLAEQPAPRTSASESGCLPLVVYDKPVKTGSTAVKFAIVDYLDARRGNHSKDGCSGNDGPCVFAPCSYAGCNDYAEKFLAGEERKRSVLGHMFGQEGLINRLGEKGYYKVTSIRPPAERWDSMYRFNQLMKGTHYGIPHTASYEEFMRRMAEKGCSLLHYYDRGGPKCGHRIRERIAKVVARYDEIIDLYDEPVGQLHKLIAPYLVVENRSPELRVPPGFDLDALLGNETLLYNALRKRRMELAGNEPLICRKVE